jgi:hypothetical protein
MTATKTRPKTRPADALAELKRLEAAAQTARQERDRVKREAQAFVNGLEALDAELGRLARTEPAQFGPDGTPSPKSRASEIQAELSRARDTSRWPDLIAGAEHAVSVAERAVTGYREANAVELATIEYRLGESLVAELSEHAGPMLAKLAELDGVKGRLMDIAASCRGRINGRDVAVDPRLEELRRLLEQHVEFNPPRSVSLTPFEDENPPTVRSAEGGWIAGGHVADSYGEQPPRIEAAR